MFSLFLFDGISILAGQRGVSGVKLVKIYIYLRNFITYSPLKGRLLA